MDILFVILKVQAGFKEIGSPYRKIMAAAKEMKKDGAGGASCVSCGACLSVCPAYRASFMERLAPRGKYALLSGVSADIDPDGPLIHETISACLQCGACSAVCSAGVDTCALVRRARSQAGPSSLVRMGLELLDRGPVSGTGLALRLAGRLLSGLSPLLGMVQDKRGLTEELPKGVKGLPRTASGPRTALFVGCVQNYLLQDAAVAVMEFVPWGVEILEGQGCCGLAALSAGMEDMALSQMERNIEAFSDKGFDILLTGCASCASMLKRYPRLLPDGHPMKAKAEALAGRVMEFSSLLAEMARGRLPFSAQGGPRAIQPHGGKNALQVPCHQRYGLGTIEGLKEAASLLGIEFDMELGCCGFGGTFFMRHKGLSETIRQEAIEECHRAGIDTIVTTCSGCLLNWHLAQRTRSGPRPLHLAQYLLNSQNGSHGRG